MGKICNWLMTGDTHSYFDELLDKLYCKNYAPEKTAIIILGDSGLNFWRGRDRGSYKMDEKLQQTLEDSKYRWYILRGNHDQRPETIPETYIWYDDEVDNDVYVREGYPNIRYLIDGNIYTFDGYRCLALGGAYSVDKWVRLQRKTLTGWCGWWANEQLNQQEMDTIYEELAARREPIDFVLSHTCPKSWEPTDLFLNTVDQSGVDKTMEEWLDKVKDVVDWQFWMFGHYHADRLECPYVIQVYEDIWSFGEVDWLWHDYKKRGPNIFEEGQWGVKLSPKEVWK